MNDGSVEKFIVDAVVNRVEVAGFIVGCGEMPSNSVAGSAVTIIVVVRMFPLILVVIVVIG